jgi:hypothetical protein
MIMGAAIEEMEKTVKIIKAGFWDFDRKVEAALFRKRLVTNTLKEIGKCLNEK